MLKMFKIRIGYILYLYGNKLGIFIKYYINKYLWWIKYKLNMSISVLIRYSYLCYM